MYINPSTFHFPWTCMWSIFCAFVFCGLLFFADILPVPTTHSRSPAGQLSSASPSPPPLRLYRAFLACAFLFAVHLCLSLSCSNPA
ncbi:uncharacterized protein BJ171DRAFT_30418 [Polychytrium aggregatum]|uniref:uncharacterized protein n=1 Tax=Polychytrium aggregatum TaxID=110093 RepID=UPI0022FED490|nr:uncharacterized protein BJ171DRAFT_30418 [Polychytrium aggregatum]KAI9206434.1 hypothetical protein BJ171DRAFT_30418 [Polychytrium aggregatum]